MKFSIGDPVYIKSNDEEGIIEEFIGKDMANVVVQSTNYHVYLEDLEHPYLRWFTQQNKEKSANPIRKVTGISQLQTEKKQTRTATLHPGIYLLCMPEYVMDYFDEQVSKCKIYIVNETRNTINSSYQCKVKQEYIFSLEFLLYPSSEFYIHDISFELLAQNPTFTFHLTDASDLTLDVDLSYLLKPKKLFSLIDKIRYENHAFFTILLLEKLIPRKREEVWLHKEFRSDYTKPTSYFDFSHAVSRSKQVIDLHIEKLLPHYQGLSSAEILQIQLKECQHGLDLAIATHQKSIILIHGVGKGVLKSEIISLLNQTKHIEKYVNDFDVRYGYGATEVFFQY
jgi:hypothetical protein